jgi:membrane protein DedA with SNARE-associated domain
LAQSHGIDAMINESFIRPTMVIGALIGALVCFLVGALVGHVLLGTSASQAIDADYTWVFTGLLGAIIGYVMMVRWSSSSSSLSSHTHAFFTSLPLCVVDVDVGS